MPKWKDFQVKVRLHHVQQFSRNDALGDVVFVHGLMGHYQNTWRSADTTMSWPLSLANRHRLNVHSLEYPAPVRDTGPAPYSFLQIRNEVLQELESRGIGRKPFVFVCHSLGGILVKSILRRVYDRGRADRFLRNCAGVAFVAVPHRGSTVASFLDGLQAIYRTSALIDLLKAECDYLEDVNHWFVSRFSELEMRATSFAETERVKGLLPIVSKASASIDLPGSDVIELAADHINICKPKSEEDLIYRRVELFCEDLLGLDREEVPIIGHFLDHHVLAAHGLSFDEISSTAADELRLATKIAWLCCDQLILAASSLFESRIAKAVLRRYPENALARLRIAGKGLNADNYARTATQLYLKDSQHRRHYVVDSIVTRVPFLPRTCSATADIKRAWTLSDPEGCLALFTSSLSTLAAREAIRRWLEVPDALEGLALIPEYILPVFRSGGKPPDPAIEAAVHEFTNRWYFDSLCSEFGGYTLEGIPYLDSATKSSPERCLEYRSLTRWLQNNRVLETVIDLDESRIIELSKASWVDRFRAYARALVRTSRQRRSA
ncbi:esterase/lipase family protein [Bradyrhizobium sp. SZCCHNRI1073]|uniref:esterase/lipase family protein n=1 Tax=Bradyrhizobium sp. SZCCHNRI1073 TaxID=3057280 RepID=UPI002916A48D|nr:alpha/beta fold hydrolase [Bradyrhizobium sp. SZCCHNRI1073]